MRIVISVAAMQRLARQWRRSSARVCLVPTMGYLHEGHLSLVRAARQRVGGAGKVVVSIYVNPTQFSPKEDLSRYPRDLKRDLKLCRAEGVDVVFSPRDTEMYSGWGEVADEPARSAARTTDAFSTYVAEENLSRVMEGASRPGHFRGVTTIVAKLFNIVQPDMAVFGAKDFQQAAVVKRIVRDLNFPLKIIVAPIVREPDGVAMSSRNKYLVGDLRRQATVLRRSIQLIQEAVANAKKPLAATKLKALVRKMVRTAPAARLDYVEFFDSSTLTPVTTVSRGSHMALAVFLGKTRLIDNMAL